MSTIFGKWNLNNKPIEKDIIFSMKNELDYWGADDSGVWLNENVGMGHLMLHNTPESLNEKLPYKDEGAGLVITADARLDNRTDLFLKLEIPSRLQGSVSDSILILKAFQKWRFDCVKHLLGAFAFAIWDDREKQFFCARDQIGINSFYFHHDSNFFAFSTEVKGLLKIPEVPRKISGTYLINALGAIFNENDACFFEKMNKLPPAHYLVLDDKDLRIEKYWELDPEKRVKYSSNEEYVEAFKEILKEAINTSTRTAFPLGCQLSGGLDSSGIAAMANKQAKHNKIPFYTFSNGIPDSSIGKVYPFKDEYNKVEQVLKFTGIQNNEKITSSHLSFLDEIEYTLKIRSHPDYISFFQNSDRHCAQAAKRGVRTMLSGFVGDEMVTSECTGYLETYFQELKWSALWQEMKIRSDVPVKSFTKRGIGVLYNMLPDVIKPYSSNHVEQFLEKSVLGPSILRKWTGHYKDLYNKKIPYMTKPFHNMKLVGNVEGLPITGRIEAEMLAARAWKVDMRYPLTDLRLMEFFLSVPLEQKVTVGEGRWLFRRAIDGWLPESILNQKKIDSVVGVIPFELSHRLEDFDRVESILRKNKNDPRFDFLNLDKTLLFWKELQLKAKPSNIAAVSTVLECMKCIENDGSMEDFIKEAISDKR